MVHQSFGEALRNEQKYSLVRQKSIKMQVEMIERIIIYFYLQSHRTLE